MKLATTIGDFVPYGTHAEAIRHIHQAGFRYLDYSFSGDYARKAGFLGDNPQAHLETVRETAAALGMQFVQAHAPIGDALVTGEAYNEFIEANRRSMEGCAALGISNIVVHGVFASGITKQETFDGNIRFYGDLLPYAEQYGVNILTENFTFRRTDPSYRLTHAIDMIELIETINHPLFHACWDTGHGNMTDVPQDESIRILGKHLRALHIQDNNGGSDQHLMPFGGTVNFDSLLHGLLDTGYDGYFTYECPHFFLAPAHRRPYPDDTRLQRPPLELKIKAEALLYEIGKTILTAYDCYEE